MSPLQGFNDSRIDSQGLRPGLHYFALSGLTASRFNSQGVALGYRILPLRG